MQPDGVQRGLVGEIIKRFEAKGFTLRGLKSVVVERGHAEKHYADLSSKPFFAGLVEYICSGPGTVFGNMAETAAMGQCKHAFKFK